MGRGRGHRRRGRRSRERRRVLRSRTLSRPTERTSTTAASTRSDTPARRSCRPPWPWPSTAPCREHALLAATVVGYEVAFRAGRCIHDSEAYYYRSCGSWGSLACAAIAANLLELSEAKTAHALGIAEYHAPYAPMFRDVDAPAMVKHACGWGAATGLTAATLAAQGFTGCPSIFEDERYRDWVRDIGHPFLITTGVMWKQYSCCAWTHPALHALERATAAAAGRRRRHPAHPCDRIPRRRPPRRPATGDHGGGAVQPGVAACRAAGRRRGLAGAGARAAAARPARARLWRLSWRWRSRRSSRDSTTSAATRTRQAPTWRRWCWSSPTAPGSTRVPCGPRSIRTAHGAGRSSPTKFRWLAAPVLRPAIVDSLIEHGLGVRRGRRLARADQRHRRRPEAGTGLTGPTVTPRRHVDSWHPRREPLTARRDGCNHSSGGRMRATPHTETRAVASWGGRCSRFC